jgi:arylsulfatase
MADDAGFGAPGTFGGVVPTPALARIAKGGLRYTNFHYTSSETDRVLSRLVS